MPSNRRLPRTAVCIAQHVNSAHCMTRARTPTGMRVSFFSPTDVCFSRHGTNASLCLVFSRPLSPPQTRPAPKGLLVAVGDVERFSGDDVVARRIALAGASLHPGEKQDSESVYLLETSRSLFRGRLHFPASMQELCAHQLVHRDSLPPPRPRLITYPPPNPARPPAKKDNGISVAAWTTYIQYAKKLKPLDFGLVTLTCLKGGRGTTTVGRKQKRVDRQDAGTRSRSEESRTYTRYHWRV